MLQVYTLAQTLVGQQPVSFTNRVLIKGCTASLGAPATIDLNKAGVYVVSCNATITGGATAGDGSLQLYRNGVAQPFAKAEATLATDDLVSVGFETLIQVQENNTRCCITSPTSLQVIYEGVDATGDINLVVTKLI